MIVCRDCQQALQPYVDRELSDEDVALVRMHLDACRGCLHLYEFEASLRRIVRTKCREQQAPDGLRQRVIECLASERERLDRASRRPAAR